MAGVYQTMSISKLGRQYGWKPDLPDQRDHKFGFTIVPAKLPASTDLRPGCPAPFNQQNLGSCTANAIAGAVEFNLIKQRLPIFMPSRLFIYYNERVMEHSVSQDAGAMIRDGIKSVNSQGVCPETMWPYVVNKFAQKPPATCYSTALHSKAVGYQRINQDIASMKACLASGFPFVFGFTVYESFESNATAKTGIMTMPGPNEQVLGGHAVLAVGYNDATQMITVRNSWGPYWGDKGYFYMPYAYITNNNLCDDFWNITLMTK